MTSIFSVSQVTSYIRNLLEGDAILNQILVEGEISNFTHHGSGHLYFTLKDAGSRLRCVMFRGRATDLQFMPAVGQSVLALGRISVYDRDGQHQLYVNSMRPAGQGKQYLRFLELKERLSKEGLFDPSHKKPLPFLPRSLGVVTSASGAAFRDILTVTKRRHPYLDILIAPAAVQGEGAAASLVEALQKIQEVPAVDIIIIGRGGGSMEELWAFNDENLARAIFNCPKPVIAAVGHETDFTIADFVADLRAPTPSAAAEAATPVWEDLERSLVSADNGLRKALENLLLQKTQAAHMAALRLGNFHPQRNLETAIQALAALDSRLHKAMGDLNEKLEQNLSMAAANLQALSPLAVLGRGYSITLQPDGSIIRQVGQVAVGDEIETVIDEGRIYSKVFSLGGIDDDNRAAEDN